ncbi:MAG: transporter substrate-binding domain-containing protein, partial [Bacteroidaceae bacterium]
MKNKRVLSLVFFLGINLSFLFASDKLEEKTLISSNDTLLVEVEGLPPFIFFDDENHLQGYAVELIDSVAAKLGKPVKFILSEKKSSISIEGEVQSTNRIHPDILFVNSITSTYDSNEYNQGIICFQSKQALMVRRWSGIEKISDLSRKKITSVDSRWILEQFQSMGIFPKLPMISPDKLMDMNLFLLNKTVDASVADIQVQKYLLQKNVSGTSSLRIIPLEAIPVFYQLMVRVDSKRVTRDQVQKIMSTFNREKTTLIMQRKWFDFSPQNELLTLNRLLSIVLAILIIISLALFFIYLAFLGENTKTKRYTDLMINAFDVFPHVVNLSEIDKKGALKKIIYRNHLIQQDFDELDLEQEGAENARQNRTETKDDSLREVNGRYFKKCSFLMDQ